MRRGLAALAMLLACLLLRLPATLVDGLLAAAGDGSVRLAWAEGSVWNGRGRLMVRDPVDRAWQPWMHLAWRFDAFRLWRGEIAWQLRDGEKPALAASLSPQGMALKGVDLAAPAWAVLERLPHALGRAGWRGQWHLQAQAWQCGWDGRCRGQARLDWQGAAAELLQDRPLGDYALQLEAAGDEYRLRWETPRGEVRISGEGRWRQGGRPALAGDIRGDPALLRRLPGVAGRWVSPGTEPGVWRFSLAG